MGGACRDGLRVSLVSMSSPAKEPQQANLIAKKRKLNVNNMSVDPKCYDERCQTAEAYRLNNGVSHG